MASFENARATAFFTAMKERVESLSRSFKAEGMAAMCVKDGLRFYVERLQLSVGNLIEVSGVDENEQDVYVLFHPLSANLCLIAAKQPEWHKPSGEGVADGING